MTKVLVGVEGIVDFERRKPIIIDRAEIEATLPLSEGKLLLDRVTIDSETVAGEFTVTELVCKGHAVAAGGKLVMRGSDLLDMTAQIAGVWARQNLIIKDHHIAKAGSWFVESYGGIKFKEVILVGYPLIMEVGIGNLKAKVSDRLIVVTGENFVATVNDNIVARSFFVKIVGFINTKNFKPTDEQSSDDQRPAEPNGTT